MARVLSQTLIRLSSSTSSPSPSSPSAALLCAKSTPLAPSSGIVPRRNRSHKSGKAQLIEVDLESDGGGGELEVLGIPKLEDAIHRIIAQRAAPAWLPFMPGSSYWVPPKHPYNLFQWVGRVANSLTEEESLSLTTVRGWPCSAYFIGSGGSPLAIPVMQLDVKVQTDSEDTSVVQSDSETISQSEDQEG